MATFTTLHVATCCFSCQSCRYNKEETMKKTYIQPLSQAIEIKTNQILMTSTESLIDTPQNGGGALSRDFDWLDE